MSRRSQLAALLFVAALVASPIVGSISLVGSAAAAPDGFVGVPDTNVEEDLPVGTNTSISAADLEGSVMASQNASSLQIVLTTPDRAEEYVGSAVGGGGGGIALVFQDDKSHAGREVAVPADAIRESVGHIPKVVHGVHEDGSSWTSDVTARNGLLLFRIPKFSANSVTFDADVSIDATATDGTTLSYDLGSMDSATDPTLNITGALSEETDTVSRSLVSGTVDPGIAGTETPPSTTLTMTGNGFGRRTDSVSAVDVGDGHSSTLDVEGSLSDTSQAADPTVTLTGREVTESESESGSGNGQVSIAGSEAVEGTLSVEKSPSQHYSIDGHTNIDSESSHTVALSNLPEFVSSIEVDIYADMPQNYDGHIDVEDGGEHVTTKSYDTPSEYDDKTVEVPVNHQFTGNLSITETDGVGRMHIVGVNVNGHSSTTSVSIGQHSTTLDIANSGGQASWDVPELSPGDHNVVDLSLGDDWTFDYTERTVTTDPSVSLNGNTKTYQGELADGETATLSWSPSVLDAGSTNSIGLSLPSSSLLADAPPMRADYAAEVEEVDGALSPSVDVDGDGSAEVSHSGLLTDGETESTEYSPQLGQTWSVDGSGSPVTVSAEITERTLPSDVAVGLNTDGGGGEWVNVSRTLDGGETVSRTFSKTTLQEGTNRLTVSLGDGSLSADAPVPKLDMSYMHASEVSIDTSYVADGWAESYNVSHTFAGSRENPTVTVPFSSRVYRIPQVEMSVNGGVWENVSASKWSLENGTELTVQLTDHDDTAGVESGDTIAVRTTGYKVDATNGQIRVVDPTAPDDPSVDAGFVVESREPGFRINVGGTENAQKVHYLYEEGWTNPADEAVISADGGQSLWVPHATEGGAARVTTIPLEPALDAGDVGVQVIDPDDPTFKVTPGKAGVGDAVTWRWYSATSGERYGLRSLSRGRFVDKSDAGPQYVSLTGDDSGETMAIQQPDGSSTVPEVGDVPGVGGGVWSDPTEGVSIQEIGIVAGWAAFVVLLVAATGRSSIRGRQRWILVGALGGGTALLALEVIRPGVVSSALSGGLREVVPLAGLAAIALVGYSVYSWWEKRKAEASTPETKVSFDLNEK